MAKLSGHLLANRSLFSLLKLLTALLSLPTTLHAVLFNLPSGHTKCISDDLRINAVAVAHYHIAIDDPHNHKISASISDPHGDRIHYTDSVQSGKFAFTAMEEGQYTVCFWSPKFELSTTIPVEFEWKTGVAAKDWAGIAKKGKIEVMELELKKLEESVHSIHEEMLFLRQREEEMQNMNQATNSRMALLSLLSLFICLAVAGLQLWHLKSFFERKKIL